MKLNIAKGIKSTIKELPFTFPIALLSTITILALLKLPVRNFKEAAAIFTGWSIGFILVALIKSINPKRWKEEEAPLHPRVSGARGSKEIKNQTKPKKEVKMKKILMRKSTIKRALQHITKWFMILGSALHSSKYIRYSRHQPSHDCCRYFSIRSCWFIVEDRNGLFEEARLHSSTCMMLYKIYIIT